MLKGPWKKRPESRTSCSIKRIKAKALPKSSQILKARERSRPQKSPSLKDVQIWKDIEVEDGIGSSAVSASTGNGSFAGR